MNDIETVRAFLEKHSDDPYKISEEEAFNRLITGNADGTGRCTQAVKDRQDRNTMRTAEEWVAELEQYYPNTGDQVIEWRREGARRIFRRIQEDAIASVRSEWRDMGYAYFNTSNEEWEWCEEKPSKEYARKIMKMALEDFKAKYGGCHD